MPDWDLRAVPYIVGASIWCLILGWLAHMLYIALKKADDDAEKPKQ